MSSQDATKSIQDSALDRVSEISYTIREAVRRALPTPPEQFFTIMIPGKVVNFDDYTVDPKDMLIPLKVQRNQAILCDDMPPLATLQSGPTGRSVARTYADAISKLVPVGSTVGIDDGATKTVEQKRYEMAMAKLSTEVPGKGQTLVELYTRKQEIYTSAVDRKTKAFHEALAHVQADPRNKTTENAHEAYDLWVQENARVYRNHVQAAYMDWVITGKKEEVEYWFAVVDQDSVLARVEQSKESMRAAVVQDEDGTVEYQTVKLEPSDWANKCLQKMTSKTNQTESAEWYTWQINRLEKTNRLLEILQTPKPDPPEPTQEEKDTAKQQVEDLKKELKDAMEAFMKAKKAYQESLQKGPSKDAAKKTEPGQTSSDAKNPGSVVTPSRDSTTSNLLDNFKSAQETLAKAQVKYDEFNVANAMDGSKAARDQTMGKLAKDGLAKTQIAENQAKIDEHKRKRQDLMRAEQGIEEILKGLETDLGISQDKSSTPSVAPVGSNAKSLDDFFTPITVEISASSSEEKVSSNATSAQASVTASGLLWHASASANLSKVQAAAQKELASADVKVSFECMRVDIHRSWMRPELFYDPDMAPGHGLRISPGPDKLNSFLDKKPGTTSGSDAVQQSLFPTVPPPLPDIPGFGNLD
ncbi:hypothetical protein FRC09_012650 [Ceratobasidium sp. 395]|nr:hypothetical protein FRC09_012650 [Ceratobasidium sp. 395]